MVDFGSLGEQPDVTVISIAPIACESSDFNEDALVDEPTHEFVCRGARCAGHFADLFHRDDWPAVEALQNPVTVRGRAAKMIRDDHSVLLTQRKNAARRFGCLLADRSNAAQEEREPRLLIKAAFIMPANPAHDKATLGSAPHRAILSLRAGRHDMFGSRRGIAPSSLRPFLQRRQSISRASSKPSFPTQIERLADSTGRSKRSPTRTYLS